ncbi:MAG: hypothetical protein AAGC60_23410 [Acidobacteriota bacterium]
MATQDTSSAEPADAQEGERPRKKVVRVQTGVRLEKRMVKVLKGLAEYLDLTMGDLLEGIVLHAFAGRAPFSEETLGKIRQLEEIYGLDLGVDDAHRLEE